MPAHDKTTTSDETKASSLALKILQKLRDYRDLLPLQLLFDLF